MLSSPCNRLSSGTVTLSHKRDRTFLTCNAVLTPNPSRLRSTWRPREILAWAPAGLAPCSHIPSTCRPSPRVPSIQQTHAECLLEAGMTRWGQGLWARGLARTGMSMCNSRCTWWPIEECGSHKKGRFDWKSKCNFELNLDRWRDYKKERKTEAKENVSPQPCKEICENSASLFPLRHTHWRTPYKSPY